MSINYSLSQLGNIITTDANGAITAMNTSSYTANLGPVGNVTITGGSNGQVLTTNGSGALSWGTVSAGNVSNANYAAYSGIVTGSSQSNITNVGTLTGLTVSGASNLGAVGNVTITGGANGQVLSTNGSGALSWATVSSGGTSNWITAPITVTGTTSNPTKGTTAIDYIRYRKTSDKTYHVQMAYRHTAVGAPGNGNYLFTLPGGLQLDTSTQYTNTNANSGQISSIPPWSAKFPGGTGYISISGNAGALAPLAYDATRFYLATSNPSAGGASLGRIHGSAYFEFSQPDLWFEADFTFIATT